MPRNFVRAPRGPLTEVPGFNEAAADAAEFCCAPHNTMSSSFGFNEAAADAAEFCNTSVTSRSCSMRLQ